MATGDTAKPPAPKMPGGHTTDPAALSRTSPAHAGAPTETISQASYQSASDSLSSSGSISSTAWAISPGRLAPATLTRRVLVVSGHSLAGGNHFGPEAAVIRRLLGPAYVDVREIACAELGEIAAHLDSHAPAVLHVAGHSSFGGVFLALNGQPVPVAHEELAECIARCRLKPHLVTLSFCQSSPLASSLIPAIESAIGWPGDVDDQQSCAYAGQLYRWLAQRSVGDAHGLACKDVEAAWPDLLMPELSGSPSREIFPP